MPAEPGDLRVPPRSGRRGSVNTIVKKDLIVSGSLLQPYITLTNGGGLPIGTRLADVLLETTVPAGETFTLYTETASLKMLDYFDVREASVQTRIVAPVGESTLAILEETAAGTGAGPAPTDYIETVRGGVVNLGGGTYLIVQPTATSFAPTTNVLGEPTLTPITTLLTTQTYVTTPPSSDAHSSSAASRESEGPSGPPGPRKVVNTGALAGGILGGLFLFAVILISIFFLLRRRRQAQAHSSGGQDDTAPNPDEESRVYNVGMGDTHAVPYEGGSAMASTSTRRESAGVGNSTNEGKDEIKEELRDWWDPRSSFASPSPNPPKRASAEGWRRGSMGKWGAAAL